MTTSLTRGHPHRTAGAGKARRCGDCGYGPAAPQHATHSSSPAQTAPTSGAAAVKSPGIVTTVRDRYDEFFTKLFRPWGYDATSRPQAPHAIATRMDARLAERRAQAEQAEREAEWVPNPDPIPPAATDPFRSTEPLDLDALGVATPPPTPPAGYAAGVEVSHYLQIDDFNRDWCNCGWMAGAHRHDQAPQLNVRGLIPPPPSASAAQPQTQPQSDPSSTN